MYGSLMTIIIQFRAIAYSQISALLGHAAAKASVMRLQVVGIPRLPLLPLVPRSFLA